MKKQGSGCIIMEGKVYFSIYYRIEDGGWLVKEVFSRPLTRKNIVEGIKIDLDESGKKTIRTTAKFMKEYRRNDPTLKVTGVKSWRQLAQRSAAYGIFWLDNSVIIQLHKLDNKGRFASANEGRKLELPGTTSLNKIAEIILNDVRQFPYALKG